MQIGGLNLLQKNTKPNEKKLRLKARAAAAGEIILQCGRAAARGR
jgi:hypothetical protein